MRGTACSVHGKAVGLVLSPILSFLSPFSFLISPCILWPVCSVFAPSQLHILQPNVLVLLTINAQALALGFSDIYLIYWVFAQSCFFGTGSLHVHLVIMYHKDMCDLEMS